MQLASRAPQLGDFPTPTRAFLRIRSWHEIVNQNRPPSQLENRQPKTLFAVLSIDETNGPKPNGSGLVLCSRLSLTPLGVRLFSLGACSSSPMHGNVCWEGHRTEAPQACSTELLRRSIQVMRFPRLD